MNNEREVIMWSALLAIDSDDEQTMRQWLEDHGALPGTYLYVREALMVDIAHMALKLIAKVPDTPPAE